MADEHPHAHAPPPPPPPPVQLHHEQHHALDLQAQQHADELHAAISPLANAAAMQQTSATDDMAAAAAAAAAFHRNSANEDDEDTVDEEQLQYDTSRLDAMASLADSNAATNHAALAQHAEAAAAAAAQPPPMPNPAATAAAAAAAAAAVGTHMHAAPGTPIPAPIPGAQTPSPASEAHNSILSRLYDPDRMQKPILWTHIKLVAPGPADQPPPGQNKWRSKDAIAAYCLKCQKQFTYTKGTSKTVSRHMIAFHGLPKNFGTPEYKATSENGSLTATAPAGGPPGPDGMPVTPKHPIKRKASSSLGTDPASMTPAAKRTAIGSMPTPPGTAGPAVVDPMVGHDIVIKWIAESVRPFAVVEDAGLAKLLKFVAPGTLYKLPSSSEMVQVATTTAATMHEYIKAQLVATCEYYTLSCDIFATTTGDAGVSESTQYCSIMVTYLTPSFDRKSFTLAVVPIHGNFNASVASGIRDAMADFNLGWNRMLNLVLPNHVLLNMVNDLPEMPHGLARSCILHSMTDLLKLYVQPGQIGGLLEQVRAFVRAVKNSSLEALGLPYLMQTDANREVLNSLITDNGICHPKKTHDMIMSLVKKRNTIDVLAPYIRVQPSANGSWSPSPDEWYLLDGVASVMRPFNDAYRAFANEVHPTRGLVIPILRRIRDFLGKLKIPTGAQGISPETANVVLELQEGLLHSFHTTMGAELEQSQVLWTVPLDPRLVGMRGLSSLEQSVVSERLVREIQQIGVQRQAASQKKGGIKSKSVNFDEHAKQSTMGGLFWGDDDDEGIDGIRDEVMENLESASDRVSLSYAQASFDRYMRLVQSHSRIDDPLAWWQANQRLFPELAVLARKWLSAHATNTAVGVDSKHQHAQMHNFPESDHVRLLTFLHNNNHLL